MSASRDLSIELTADQSRFETVRTAFGVWNDVLYQLSDASYQLRAIGEDRQAEAMAIDAESMARRARLHLKNVTAREQAKLEALEADKLLELAFGVYLHPTE